MISKSYFDMNQPDVSDKLTKMIFDYIQEYPGKRIEVLTGLLNNERLLILNHYQV
jgi:hypothetical protein